MAWSITKAKLPAGWYEASGAARFGLSPAHARQIAEESARAVAARGRTAELHLQELMLARACAQGSAEAWEEFWRHYQPRLRRAARALTHDAARAEELADGLLGDLFGMPRRDGTRQSKLGAYMGLGSLEAWLSALLAQAHIERWRRERHHVSLEDCAPLLGSMATAAPELDQPALGMALDGALGTALGGLEEAARLLLSLYFLDGQTLAAIALLLGVHESTVSRRLERTLTQLRRQTRRELGRGGLRPAAAEAAMRTDPHWLRLDVRTVLQRPHGL
ncbi:MAG: RNA polymerase sigma factor [Terriglobales bacterium]